MVMAIQVFTLSPFADIIFLVNSCNLPFFFSLFVFCLFCIIFFLVHPYMTGHIHLPFMQWSTYCYTYGAAYTHNMCIEIYVDRKVCVHVGLKMYLKFFYNWF